jgi:hypothetical protein
VKIAAMIISVNRDEGLRSIKSSLQIIYQHAFKPRTVNPAGRACDAQLRLLEPGRLITGWLWAEKFLTVKQLAPDENNA